MTRRKWIYVLVLIALVAGAAILIGILATRGGGESQAEAQTNFCSSATELQGSVQSLTSLSPTSASKTDYQSAVSNVESAWEQVKTDAGDLKDVDTSALDSSWDSFKSAVDNVPSDASVSDALTAVSQSAQSLLSTTQSTLSGPDCSTS